MPLILLRVVRGGTRTTKGQQSVVPCLPVHRGFCSSHRLADRYARTVVSLVVLADDNPNWRPDHYEAAQWGCRVRLDYPICRLLDWLMWLPEALAVAFRRQVIQYEAEKSMPYVTSTEKLARAEGRQQGRQEGRQEDILDILQARFNDVPYALCEQVKAIHDENVLRECLRDAALLPTLDAFRAKLCR